MVTDGAAPSRTTHRVPVRFEGPGAGVGDLSWGQRELWHAIHMRDTWLPVGGVFPLPTGTTLDDVVTDLRFVMGRYPTTRTRLRPDPDRPDLPRQVVHGSGEIGLEIVEAADQEEPADVADQVWNGYRERDLDLVTQWPVRTAVIRHRGVLTHRVWAMSHLVTDGYGSRVMIEDRKARLAGRPAGGNGLSALEQARWQATAAGQRQSANALRYWERVLRSVPAQRFPAYTGTLRRRYREVRFRSRALHLATRALHARTGAESSSVLLTGFVVALARLTGVNPVVVVLVVNNRFRPGLAGTVSPLIQPGLFLVTLDDTTVDAAVARVRGRALVAYKHAYHDPPAREALIERVNRERGEVDLECTFNDRRLVSHVDSGPAPTPEQVRAALPETELRWTTQRDHPACDKLYVFVDDVPDTVQLTVGTDAHRLAPKTVEQCLRTMEAVAVAAALDPSTRTGVGPAPDLATPSAFLDRTSTRLTGS